MAIIDDFYGRDLAFKSDFIVSPSGDLETMEGLANLKEALFKRLVSHPGSLIHRPNYGVGIKNFQNALSSRSNQIELALRIKEQFMQDPRVEDVTGFAVKNDSTRPEYTEIIIRVKARGYDEQAMTFIPFGEQV